MFEFFNSRESKAKETATYVAGGVAVAFLFFHYPITLLFGLLIAAAFYAKNDPKGASKLVNRMG